MRSGLLFLCCVALCCASLTSSSARQKSNSTPQRHSTASVSGRVFLITESGDMKPARFAHVYLLYLWSGIPQTGQAANAPSPDTAGTVFLSKQTEGMQQEIEEMKDASTPTDESFHCKRRLLTVKKALLETVDWAKESNKSQQLIGTDTDEEGIFHSSGIGPGRYTVIALGRAGANDAFWATEVFARSGEPVSVKLHSPETACLDLPASQ